MLSNYCENIREKYGITIGQVKRLIPTLNSKEKHIEIEIEIYNYILILD